MPDEWLERVRALNARLLEAYGPQGWWPVFENGSPRPVYRPGREGALVSESSAFEIIVGAVLAQNTAWANAEQALINLKNAGLMDLDALAALCPADLCPADRDFPIPALIRPARYFNQKALRLTGIARNLLALGGIAGLRAMETPPLRKLLLSLNGIGPETADCVLCYACARPVFVVDAYTRRLFSALDLPSATYEVMQELTHAAIAPSAAVYGDLHARVVRLGASGEMAAFVEKFKCPPWPPSTAPTPAPATPAPGPAAPGPVSDPAGPR